MVEQAESARSTSWLYAHMSDPTPIRTLVVEATRAALHAVREPRFYATERGYHGRFYCALQSEFDRRGWPATGALLEMEYQKSERHNTFQRPDIVLHVPVSHPGTSVRENNFAVWALKRAARVADATDDFAKLDEMFDALDYPLGFFINVDASNPLRSHYTGRHESRLYAAAVAFSSGGIEVHWAPPSDER